MDSIIGKVTVGTLIRSYRHSNELSLDEMVHKIKVSKAQLQKIESGKLRLSLKEVASIAKKLDASKAQYAKVWCEEEVQTVGLEFEDLIQVI